MAQSPVIIIAMLCPHTHHEMEIDMGVENIGSGHAGSAGMEMEMAMIDGIGIRDDTK